VDFEIRAPLALSIKNSSDVRFFALGLGTNALGGDIGSTIDVGCRLCDDVDIATVIGSFRSWAYVL
jgi:hypothetical protein